MSFNLSSMGRGELCHGQCMVLLLEGRMQDIGTAKPNTRGMQDIGTAKPNTRGTMYMPWT